MKKKRHELEGSRPLGIKRISINDDTRICYRMHKILSKAYLFPVV
jgi:hypothetical protein